MEKMPKPYVNHLGRRHQVVRMLWDATWLLCKVVAAVGGIRVEEFLVAGVRRKDCTYRKDLFFRKGLFPR